FAGGSARQRRRRKRQRRRRHRSNRRSRQEVVTTLIAPAAAAGALTYGYMRWKGISIASLMYVTKQNMANAVASMTKHLEQVQSSLAAAKRHLTQRIQHLDDKLDQQKQISGQIKEEVTGARLKLQDIGSEMQKIKQVAHGLGGKLDSIEAKQNYSLAGVMYLVEFIEQNGGRLPRSVVSLKHTIQQSTHYALRIKNL
ncbi:Os01g0185100, partial [Oryza sativa Japonica Group]